MTVITLLSVKGSPGVTTAAAAMAAASTAAGRRTLLVELDPSGGDLRLLGASPPSEPNLVHAAGELRHARSAAEALDTQAAEVVPGLSALAAPAGATEATAVVASIGDRWAPAFRAYDGTVVVDAGRWDPRQDTAGRIHGADVVALVCRSTAVGVEHARHLVVTVRQAAQRPVAAIVVGQRPYAPEEVAAALDLPLAGGIAWDPRGAAALWAKGAVPGGLRSQLVRSAARGLAGLEAVLPARHTAPAHVPEVTAEAPPPPPPPPPPVTVAAEGGNGNGPG
jgi:MinD-like ATPase involved in chromosome partitioning or flagellar assembly